MCRDIDIAECTSIGHILKTHGLHGEVVVKFSPSYGDTLEEVAFLFLEIEGGLVPFLIEEDTLRYRTSETANIAFQTYDDVDAVDPYVGCKIYVFNEDLIIDEEILDYSILEGYDVEDADKGNLGEVIRVDDFSGNIILVIEIDGDENMIPFNTEMVKNIMHDQRRILVDLPEGLLELNE
ncbi:ribosome maturation factor RimM [Prolixibacteraceae bacterium]|nr:ribosome maturation factor RimM [Prolixibacteraceae bacterium]